jgi:hypothetical protein
VVKNRPVLILDANERWIPTIVMNAAEIYPLPWEENFAKLAMYCDEISEQQPI